MTTRTNPDGTIDVRVVLTVTVDPVVWAGQFINENHPFEVTQTLVRRDVKAHVRQLVADEAEFKHVSVQGVYS